MRTSDIALVCFTNLFARLHCYALSPLLPLEISRRHLSSTIDAIIFNAYSFSQIFAPLFLLSPCLKSVRFSSFLLTGVLSIALSFAIIALFYSAPSSSLFITITILAWVLECTGRGPSHDLLYFAPHQAISSEWESCFVSLIVLVALFLLNLVLLLVFSNIVKRYIACYLSMLVIDSIINSKLMGTMSFWAWIDL